MATKIEAWQLIEDHLEPIDSALQKEGRTEPYDLEPWLESNPGVIANDILIIGRQVKSKSGEIDLLGLDRAGNAVIIELKRDILPREALAQAIDYASDVDEWTADRFSEIYSNYKSSKILKDAFADFFQDVDLDSLEINRSQRILLVGFSIESALERMIEWLSNTYAMQINAIVLAYARTKSGDELIMRTAIISEEIEHERTATRKGFIISKSDEPGHYDSIILKEKLMNYLQSTRDTVSAIRFIVLPALLKTTTVLTHEMLKEAFSASGYTERVGTYISHFSRELGIAKNDFLRQVVQYEHPLERPWTKDNFIIKEEFRELVRSILDELPPDESGSSNHEEKSEHD